MLKSREGSKNEKGVIIPILLVVVANFWHNGGKGFKCGVHWINEDLCRADREANFFVWDQRRKQLEQREQFIQRREQQSKQSQLTKQ